MGRRAGGWEGGPMNGKEACEMLTSGLDMAFTCINSQQLWLLAY